MPRFVHGFGDLAVTPPSAMRPARSPGRRSASRGAGVFTSLVPGPAHFAVDHAAEADPACSRRWPPGSQDCFVLAGLSALDVLPLTQPKSSPLIIFSVVRIGLLSM
jgi:hypothetical protein